MAGAFGLGTRPKAAADDAMPMPIDFDRYAAGTRRSKR
jgi:hypothetical protein